MSENAIRTINKNGLQALYFLLGNDFFLQKFFVNNIKKIFDCNKVKYLNLNDKKDFAILLDDLDTVSMFSSKNIFALRNFNTLSSNNQRLIESYVNDPNTENILIFILNDFKITNKFSKMLSSKSILVDIQTPFYDSKIRNG